jgi:hypothetical protein
VTTQPMMTTTSRRFVDVHMSIPRQNHPRRPAIT